MGRENLCDAPVFTGYTRDSGYAEYCAAYTGYVFPLPESADPVALDTATGMGTGASPRPSGRLGCFNAPPSIGRRSESVTSRPHQPGCRVAALRKGRSGATPAALIGGRGVVSANRVVCGASAASAS